MSALLDVHDVVVAFGGNRALDGVRIQIRAGERVALIGPNGAGKSTLINVVAGLVAPQEGRVVFDGRDLRGVRAHRRARSGLVRTFQDLQLFGTLTVHENVLAALEAQRRAGPSGLRDADEILDEIGIAAYAHEPVEVLPYGLRKLCELGRALAAGPRLMLLDEPAAGLDATEKRTFVEVLRRALDVRDTALLVVEHDMPTVRALADHVHVLDAGRPLAEGRFDEIAVDERVVAAYLGPSA